MLELLFLRHLTELLLEHIRIALEATTYQTTLIGRQVIDRIDALRGIFVPRSEDDDVRAFAHTVGVQCACDHLLLELLVPDDDESELLQPRGGWCQACRFDDLHQILFAELLCRVISLGGVAPHEVI